jgi:hypothetical protein
MALPSNMAECGDCGMSYYTDMGPHTCPLTCEHCSCDRCCECGEERDDE